MRLFVGVELDDHVRAACAVAALDLQERLRRARANLAVRWIAEPNLHITLWFLGEVPDDKTAAIADALRLAWSTAAFTLTVSGSGAFPTSGAPRIVWLGVTEGGDRLADLYQELAVRLMPLGFEPERRSYQPHLTLGRVKEAGRTSWRTARSALTREAPRYGSCQVRAVTLFRSRLSPTGARYEPLLRVPLKKC